MDYYDKINKIIEDYLTQENTEHALFLYGEWGSGKTHYATNELVKCIGDKKYEPLYFSLNGISNISALQRKIFFQSITKNPKEISWSQIEGFTSITSNTGTIKRDIIRLGIDLFNMHGTKKIKESLGYGGFKNKILIFDDLERIPEEKYIKEILGYLFDEFISRGIKVLIIGNEKEVRNIYSDFNRTKEKIFRWEIRFSPSWEDLCKSIINHSFPEPDCKDNKNYRANKNLLLKNSDIINYVFENSGKNLRSIIFALQSFDYILKVAKKIAVKNKRCKNRIRQSYYSAPSHNPWNINRVMK